MSQPPDPSAFAAAVAAAAARRAGMPHEALRLFDGRFEGADGWTLDRFGGVLLLQSFHPEGADPACMDAVLDLRLGDALVLKERGVGDRARAEGRLVVGTLPAADPDDPFADRPGRFCVQEDGLRFGVDLLYGQNPGLFLDARPLRAWVRQRSAERRVLNLFAYTGAFGVHAFAGGGSAENVDVVPSAIDRCRANHELNGFHDDRAHQRAEVFDFLRRARRRGRRWHGVIADPPPVKTQGTRRRGRGRERGFDPAVDVAALHRAIESVLAPDGWVLALSAARTEAWFEEQLPEGDWQPLRRADDFPGPRRDGLRALVRGAPASG